MNHRVNIKTPEQRAVDALAYYYKNREAILLKKKMKRSAEKINE